MHDVHIDKEHNDKK